MDAVLKSEIFFFISSLAVGLLTVAGAIAAVYIIKILRDVSELVTSVRRQVDKISDEIDAMLARMRDRDARSRRWLARLIDIFIKK